jgi:hypothetical protein
VAASVGLKGARRLYKGFHDLRLAISAKNAAIKKRRQEAMMAALVAAFNEQPVPTIADVARRLGYATVKPLTSRFQELSIKLRTCRQRVTRQKSGHRVNERVRQKLTEALGDSPPPSCAEVVRRLAGHRTQIREDFPDLWRALRGRHVNYRQEAYISRRKAIAAEAHRIILELQEKGIYPSIRSVRASMSSRRLQCPQIIAEAVRQVRRELSIQTCKIYHVEP